MNPYDTTADRVADHVVGLHHQPKPNPTRAYPETSPAGAQEYERKQRTALWRWTHPRAARWEAVAAFDEQSDRLDAAEREVRQRLQELYAAVRDAQRVDREAMATHVLYPEGPRPEPTLPGLEQQVESAKAELGGIEEARERTLEEKREHVGRNRARLVADAEQDTQAAARVYEETIKRAVRAREELCACRSLTLWCSLFGRDGIEPHEVELPRRGICGDRRRPLERAGIGGPVQPDDLFDALEDDARYLRSASTPQQRKHLPGHADDPDIEAEAVWVQDERGKEALRRQNQRNRERVTQAMRATTEWESDE